MSDLLPEDIRWLDAAARYASAWLGTTSDSPTVGALVVSPTSQSVLARAVTSKGGRPHAAAQAIATAGFDAAGCTLYLTLEPCHHWGRTPPCVDAIIRSGIMRVVIGVADPDPRAGGGSVAQLESAGIEATIANHAPSIALHAGHAMRHQGDRPYVTAVLTVSAEGVITSLAEGQGSVIGAAARYWIDVAQSRSDAVLVGAATAIADNPNLTVDLPGLAAQTPLRVILSGAKGIDRSVNLVGGFSGYRTAIIAEKSVPIDAPVSVEVIRLPGVDGRVNLKDALSSLGKKGVQNLLVQPGQRLTTGLLEAELVDRFAIVSSGKEVSLAGVSSAKTKPVAGMLAEAGFEQVETRRLGDEELTLYERPSAP